MDAGRVERLQQLLRVAVRKVQREAADLVRLGNPVEGNLDFVTFYQGDHDKVPRLGCVNHGHLGVNSIELLEIVMKIFLIF